MWSVCATHVISIHSLKKRVFCVIINYHFIMVLMYLFRSQHSDHRLHWRPQIKTEIRHCIGVIMGTLASQITSLTIVYSVVYWGVGQRKHQSSASLAFVRGIHRWPVNSPHKWPVTRKMFPFDDAIIELNCRYKFLVTPWKESARHNLSYLNSNNVFTTTFLVNCPGKLWKGNTSVHEKSMQTT